MSEIINCDIRALVPELAADYLAFFDRDAFADNPRWAFCYCYFNQAPHELRDWNKRTATENREAVCRLISAREMTGYLAYYGGKVIGWCNAGPRERMTTLPEIEALDGLRICSIVCFLIAPAYRGRGVARQLLAAACDGLRRKGFSAAEAYPRDTAAGAAANHYGPMGLYEAAGFNIVSRMDGVVIVRKRL